jgi:alpha/beta hydrolase fold
MTGTRGAAFMNVTRGLMVFWRQPFVILVFAVAVVAACDGSGPSPSAATLTATTPASTPTRPPTAAPSSNVLQGTFDIGGYALWIACVGGPGPTVVFESGLGSGHNTWGSVLANLGSATRVCRYDRAGIGASDARPSIAPVSVGTMADELHRLLDAAGIEGPYVVVAHSYGGMIARVFAHTFPDEVSGLVLVDASSGHQFEGDWLANDDPWVDGSSAVDRETSQVELAAFDSLGSLPLIVLTQGQIDGDFKIDWTRFQTELAALSSNSLRIIARDSDHMIQEVQPELVAAAARAVIEAASTGGRLAACDARFTDLGAECTD